MENEELLELNSEGLFPGPGETEEKFRQRVLAAKDFFYKQESAIAPQHWQWASEQLRALYDFTPRWCSAIYSSKGLAPWQAAATWIQKEKGVKPFYMIQIRPSKWVSWLIDRDELLAHEAVHAARAAFEEPKAEELFAYLTSIAKWRRIIGPLFSQPKDSLLMVGILSLGAVLQMIETIWDVFLFSGICFSAAAVLAAVWSFRLLRMRSYLAKASRQIIPFLRDPSKARAALFRLTDQEIIELASGKIEEKNELRWQLLKAAYLK